MRRPAAVVTAGLLWTCAVTAQEVATKPPQTQIVVIRVLDPSVTPIREAPVEVTPLAAAPESTKTDANGKVQLRLKPGAYTLSVKVGGFKQYAKQITVTESRNPQEISAVLEVPVGDRVFVEGPPVPPEKDALEILSPVGSYAVTLRKLQDMTRKTIVVHGPHTNQDERYEGVELAELLRWYGAPVGQQLRGAALADYVVATGSDGYKAVFSLAEIDPSFHPGDVLVADTMNGKPLDAHSGPFRLVVTEDQRPARGVRNLVSLEVKTAQ